ncbi:MAG: hypothetical protein ACP5I7_00045 [Sulfolobales archaeon]
MIDSKDPYECLHPHRVCREKCAERSIFKEDFKKCVEECLKDLENKCRER